MVLESAGIISRFVMVLESAGIISQIFIRSVVKCRDSLLLIALDSTFDRFCCGHFAIYEFFVTQNILNSQISMVIVCSRGNLTYSTLISTFKCLDLCKVTISMDDRISNLSDDLLLKIVSSLPTKEVVATMVLSKRWKPLWKSVPKLVYDDRNLDMEGHRFSRYVHSSLSRHEAPVLEKLSFKLSPNFTSVDIGTWVDLGVTRHLRKLHILLTGNWMPIRLPESLYTCKTLECLKLSGGVLVEVVDPVCLPSLFKLFLLEVTYSSEESFQRLLSGCPILECLVLRQTKGDNLPTFTIKVPSLVTLGISRHDNNLWEEDKDQGFIIGAPSLSWLSITDYTEGFCLMEDIPMLDVASVDLEDNSSEDFIGSLTSVNCLQLCVSIPKHMYPKGMTFRRLKELELCTCTGVWMDLLMSLLQDSPRLKSLKLYLGHLPNCERPVWNQPSSIPECLLFKLETMKWSNYEGSEEEEKLVKYILRYGFSLKTVIITSNSTIPQEQKLRMISETALFFRASPTCQLYFN